MSVSSPTLVAAVPLCSPTDFYVLRDFYKSVNSSRLLSWSVQDNCCLWMGISCNYEGQVVSADLPSLSLTGAIPSILFNLSALQSLDLSNNLFIGGIPPTIADSFNLIVLDLSYNKLLMGPFPHSLPPALGHLDVSHCAFHGMVPSSITNSLSIRELLINGNQFSSFASSNNASLAALQILDASDNLFASDSLQFLMNCTRVRYLNLDRNQVQGQMPWQLGELADLEILRLQENLLTGPIPQVIGSCMKMRELWLDNNRLHGVIPETLGKLSMLTVLSLANNSLEGPFPKAITNCASLRFLSLSGNRLSGSIPANLGSLRQFSGFIPPKRITSGSKHWPWSMGKFLNVGIFWVRSLISYLPQSHLTFELVPCFKNACLDSPESVSLNPVQPYRHLLQSNERGSDDPKEMSPIVIGVLAGVVVFSSVLLIVAIVVLCRVKDGPWQRVRFGRPPTKLPSLRKFRRESSRVFDPTLASISMRALVKATDGFDASRVVGDGGFGLVYSATLADGRMVAVKKLSTDGIQGKREFEAEMETLGKIKHPNLVELLAYCNVADERVLVYEFVQFGSLDTWLHEKEEGPRQLTWDRRVKIAQGSARGLSYLHYESEPHVIHRDIKSSNILLEKDFEPKIADFGLARALSPLVSHVSTGVAGTLGYMAPEYSMTLNATKQADVYSFGMVMLELASGRRPNLLIQEKNFRSLAKWARHMFQLGYEMEVLDSILRKMPPPSDQVRSYFAVACDCASENPKERPTMRAAYERLSLIGRP